MPEILAVLAIICVLMAIAISSFTGTKRTGHYKVATAAAVTYADAIEAYMADNGQVPPTLGSAVWPSGSKKQRIAGPLNLMLVDPSGKPRRYMKQAAPEAFTNGSVDFGANKASAASTAQVYITYQVVGAEYRLLVETLPRSTDAPVLKCIVTNSASLPAGIERC